MHQHKCKIYKMFLFCILVNILIILWHYKFIFHSKPDKEKFNLQFNTANIQIPTHRGNCRSDQGRRMNFLHVTTISYVEWSRNNTCFVTTISAKQSHDGKYKVTRKLCVIVKGCYSWLKSKSKSAVPLVCAAPFTGHL